MASIRKTFGVRVKALRAGRRMTQEQLGQAVGVDYKHIGAIERGIRAPSFDVIERLARVLKVAPYQFFLPSDATPIDLDAELRAVASQMTKPQRATIQRLLHNVLVAAKKLDRS